MKYFTQTRNDANHFDQLPNLSLPRTKPWPLSRSIPLNTNTVKPALTVTTVKRSTAHNGQFLALPMFFTI